MTALTISTQTPENLRSIIRSAAHKELEETVEELLKNSRKFDQSSRDVASLTRDAWLFAVASQFDDAEKLLLEISNRDIDNGEADYGLAAIKYVQGDIDKSNFHIQRSIKKLKLPIESESYIFTHINEAEIHLFLFPLALNDRNLDPFNHDFSWLALPAPISQVSHRSYARYFELALPKLGMMSERAGVALKADYVINGETYWFHVHQAHRAWLSNDIDAADRHYEAAKNFALSEQILPAHFNSGVFTWLSTDRLKSSDNHFDEDRFKPSSWVSRVFYSSIVPDKNSSTTILVACDKKYFKYFPKFLMSVLTAAKVKSDWGGVELHVHVDDPTEDQIKFLEEQFEHAVSLLPKIGLSYSISNIPFKEPAIFTCLRFLFLPELLKYCGQRVFVFDIDDIVTASFFDDVRRVDDIDLALHLHNFDDNLVQFCGEPWSINASQIFIRNNESGKLFAQCISRYIIKAYNPKMPTNWTIDQNALGRSFSEVRLNYPNIRILNIFRSGSFSVMPHTIGGKDALMAHDGIIDIQNFSDILNERLA